MTADAAWLENSLVSMFRSESVVKMWSRHGVIASLLSLAGFSMIPYASAQQAPAPSADLAGIAHVAIRVKDLDTSVAFYEKLGFVKAFALAREGKVYEAFIKINDQQFLELYPADAKNTEIGFLHVCFYGNDLNSVRDYYVAHGLTPNAVRTAGAGNLLFTMPGPETPTGPQNMEYTQYMPASMHSKAVGQFLGPDRISNQISQVAIAFLRPDEASAFYRDKAGFIPIDPHRPHPGAIDVFAIPGNPGESIRLAPAVEQHEKAHIVFSVDATVAAKLKAHGLEAHLGFAEEKNDLVLSDPDGNQIVLRDR
jgi:catechol 2,3-dioxygenase-like lactoylglutathione lyase family enzyme